jgi:hypothetical protein
MGKEESLGVRTLDMSGIRVFAVACASRVAGVVGHFGQCETKREFDGVLNELWSLAVSTGGTTADCERLLQRIESCSEASIDDCYRRGYYAMRGLGVLADAITAVCADDAAAGAASASDGATSLAADIAFEARQSNNGATTPSGDGEAAFHARLIDIIKSSPEHVLEQVRVACQHESWPVESLVSIDVAHGWSRGDPWVPKTPSGGE